MRYSNTGNRQNSNSNEQNSSNENINLSEELAQMERAAPSKDLSGVVEDEKVVEERIEKTISKQTPSNKKSKKEKKEKKPKKKREQVLGEELPKLTTGRKVKAVFVSIFFSSILVLGVISLYMNYIKYPKAMIVQNETTGIYCLHKWQDSVHSLEGVKEGYIAQEVDYANDDELRLGFMKQVASTIKYTPGQETAKNVYGNDMIDKKTGDIVKQDSNVKVGESVTLTYVDYTKIKIDAAEIRELMKEHKLKLGAVDYSNKLIDVFCDYIGKIKELPTKQEERVPSMVAGKNEYTMEVDEDIFIDNLLFASEELDDLMLRFSIAAGSTGDTNPAWEEWNKLDKEKKEEVEEPNKVIDELVPTDEWKEWEKKVVEKEGSIEKIIEDKKAKEEEPKKEENSEEEKVEEPVEDKSEEETAKLESEIEALKKEEPIKYNSKEIMNTLWCGSYYLQNEHTIKDENGKTIKDKISATKGEGTFEDPAGFYTPVITSIFVKEKNEEDKEVEKEYPIKVELEEYDVSENAIVWFEGKDKQNRGINVNSEVQLCYYKFKVTNLSDKELLIYDNSSLADKNANLVSRTGVMYGLQDSVKLKPDEEGYIESWGRSTELNKVYVIWGKDFARKKDPVWFRLLAGNIDDPSEDKGVSINKSRHNETEDSIE